MVDDFDTMLDSCLDRIQAGEDLEPILASHPADSSRLRPILQAAVDIRESYAFAPSSIGKEASRQRFIEALAQMQQANGPRKSWISRAFSRPATWAALATVVVALFVVYVGVRPVLSPGAPVILPISPLPVANGNFSFLVSDDVNAIADFTDVTVGIARIGLQQAEGGKWVEITPETQSVDLTRLPGAATQEIWRGNVPAGNYQQVFVYAANVTGTLKSTGQRIDIKLPSQKLHMSIPFSVSDSTVTSFTYDMTVFRTGNGRNAKYILKPVVAESGATQVTRDAEGRGNPEKPAVPEQRPTNLPTPGNKPPKK